MTKNKRRTRTVDTANEIHRLLGEAYAYYTDRRGYGVILRKARRKTELLLSDIERLLEPQS